MSIDKPDITHSYLTKLNKNEETYNVGKQTIKITFLQSANCIEWIWLLWRCRFLVDG